jgi:hypothetical protein
MRYFWNTAVDLDRTTAFTLDEGQRFPICQPEPLRRLFQTAAQLGKVEIRSIDVVTTSSISKITGPHFWVAKVPLPVMLFRFLRKKELP